MFAVLLSCTIFIQIVNGQSGVVNRNAFFKDTSLLNATLVVNMTKILNHNNKKGFDMTGTFITTLPDGTKVNDEILVEKRGHFRSDFCYVPPVKLVFNYKDSAKLFSLKSMKLVSECKVSQDHEQFLFKEYLCYKIYNLLSSKSFQVRLLNIKWEDTVGKKKTINEYGFLLEDLKDVATRNNCTEWKRNKLNTEQTDRRQMTMVAIFEYMIGNTDWAVTVEHNTRLILSKDDTLSKPFVVPYDFDYSGLVNTYYSVPDEKLEIESVTQRAYRGFPRTMPELQSVLDTFRKQKKNIYDLINNFSYLTPRSKKEMIGYLSEFFDMIENQKLVKSAFIDNARLQ
ncbi:MAG TPA: hypothetical protein VFE04_07315 [Puia sp.]|nr:hypothetical protein [Puia sp.]